MTTVFPIRRTFKCLDLVRDVFVLSKLRGFVKEGEPYGDGTGWGDCALAIYKAYGPVFENLQMSAETYLEIVEFCVDKVAKRPKKP